MIKAMYIYKTKTNNLPELMEKFKESREEKFITTPNNEGINMYKEVQGEDTFIYLDIFYESLETFKYRKNFEDNDKRWQEIWFNKTNKHEEIAVHILEVL